jgi:hypothetical protein
VALLTFDFSITFEDNELGPGEEMEWHGIREDKGESPSRASRILTGIESEEEVPLSLALDQKGKGKRTEVSPGVKRRHNSTGAVYKLQDQRQLL